MMQTTNRHAPNFCGCVPEGQPSPHTDASQCAANRAATLGQLRHQAETALDGTIARGEALAARHDTHLTPHYGCPECPLDSRFRRDSAQGEWYIPQ